MATVGEGGEKKSRSKSAGQGAEGPWATREGHAGSRQGSLAAHRTMTALVFSLEGEGGTEFSPSRFLSDPSSSCWGKKKHTQRKKINSREEKDGTESAPFGNQAKERRREGKGDGRRGARQDLGQKREKVEN